MKCDMFENLIFEKLENCINEHNEKLLLEHLEICPNCEKQYQELNVLKNGFKKIPKITVSATFDQKLWDKINQISVDSSDCERSENLIAQKIYENISDNDQDFLNNHLETCVRCQNSQDELVNLKDITNQSKLKVSASFEDGLRQKLALANKPSVIDLNKYRKKSNLFSKISAYVAGVAVIVISFITISDNLTANKSAISISNQNVVAIQNDTISSDDSLQVLKDKKKLLRFDKMMQVSDEE